MVEVCKPSVPHTGGVKVRVPQPNRSKYKASVDLEAVISKKEVYAGKLSQILQGENLRFWRNLLTG